ncbi:MAG: hypothetical protein AAFZ15_17680 [Bacteroidota bacterium]
MENTYRTIVIKGFDLLRQKKNYKQATVVRKIKSLGFSTSEASFSNIIKGRKAGGTALWENAEGMKKLVLAECSYQWSAPEHEFVEIPGQQTNVPEWAGPQQSGVVFYDKGRLDIRDKVRFFSAAREEMIEFGLTLNTFTGYFFSRREEEFKEPIHQLLKSGVNIKCFLLHPDSNEANLYFNDRKKFYIEEREGIGKIRTAMANFKIILQELEQLPYPGKMEVYTYRHIPHQYMLAVDKDAKNGKFHVSHYLYGELRARCPIIECERSNNPALFLRYAASLKKLMKDAQLVTDFDQFIK